MHCLRLRLCPNPPVALAERSSPLSRSTSCALRASRDCVSPSSACKQHTGKDASSKRVNGARELLGARREVGRLHCNRQLGMRQTKAASGFFEEARL